MDKQPECRLSGSTLTIIAAIVFMIVFFFGNSGSRYADEVRDLKAEIRRMDDTLTAQTRQVRSLEQVMKTVAVQASCPAGTAKPEPAVSP